MIERVVVPVDLTPASEHAIPTAVAVGGAAGAVVELVTVVEPSRRDEAEVKAAQLARRAGAGAEWRVVESGGPPEPALLAELHRSERALWCVGSHARGALGEMVFGSVSEELVRDAHVPVLLVGPHVGQPPAGTVLAVAVDGSEGSEAILPAALDLATAIGMTLRVLQVVEPRTAGLRADVAETAYVARVAERLGSGRDADYDVLHGNDAAETLADYVARQPEIGMIALATRGLSGGARLLHGSTAFDLAHRVALPVLVLHARDAAA